MLLARDPTSEVVDDAEGFVDVAMPPAGCDHVKRVDGFEKFASRGRG